MMKKRILSMLAAALIVGGAALVLLTGCNKQLVDTTYSYDTAVISLPDGTTVRGKVESWKDYGDGDQILPVDYSDNYFHLLPGEKRTIKVAWNNEDMRKGNPVVDVTGFNVK